MFRSFLNFALGEASTELATPKVTPPSAEPEPVAPPAPPEGDIKGGESPLEKKTPTAEDFNAALLSKTKLDNPDWLLDELEGPKAPARAEAPKPSKPAQVDTAAILRDAKNYIYLQETARKLLEEASLPENQLFHLTKIGQKWYDDTQLPKKIAEYEELTGEKPDVSLSGWYRKNSEGKYVVSKPASEEEVAIFLAATHNK